MRDCRNLLWSKWRTGQQQELFKKIRYIGEGGFYVAMTLVGIVLLMGNFSVRVRGIEFEFLGPVVVLVLVEMIARRNVLIRRLGAVLEERGN